MNNTMLLYAHLTDRELLRKSKSGLKTCYEVLIRRHTQALYRVARMYGFAHNEAEELLQHTHITAYYFQPQFEESVSYRTWLTKIMIEKCLEHKKGAKVKQNNDTLDPSSNPARSPQHYDTERLVISQEVNGKLEEFIEQLPMALRSVYILSEIDGYSNAEVANLLSASEENIRFRLGRAKSTLRKSLRRWFQYTDVYPFDHHSCERVVHFIMKHLHEKTELPLGMPAY